MTQRHPISGNVHSIKVETEVPTRMRDGTVLYADVVRPDASGRFPVILQRTPYDKRAGRAAMGLEAINLATHGYAVVTQDCRGRFSSEGEWNPFFDEIQDGYDTVEWCAAQPWSNGKVGMFGGSYVGATQWLAAIARPPSLVAISPRITSSNYYEGWTYVGGALAWGFASSWTMGNLAAANIETIRRNKEIPQSMVQSLVTSVDQMDEPFKTLPLRNLPGLNRDLAPYFYDWISHPTYDDYWRRIAIEERHNQVTVPSFNSGGWFDIFLGGTLKNYVGMRAKGTTPGARDARLLIGPWYHGPHGSIAGDYYFGAGAADVAVDLAGRQVRFFNHWLKGQDDGYSREAPVRIFVMGDNVWRTENEWPLARAQNVNFYLQSGGRANTLNGDGLLSRDLPGASQSPDSFLYDPRNPVPTRGGGLCCNAIFLPGGSYDQRPVEARADVLCYTTPPLAVDTEVTGPITVTLYASSSAPDTDFTAKLVDVCPAPDHCVHGLTDGIIRARYRNSTTGAAAPLTPGRVEKYTIDLVSTANVFKKGHSIRVDISSSNFPRFDRNLNTGKEGWQDAEIRVAQQTIFHSAEYPSHITLPVIPRN
ncbi:MAG: CocE/NonD family hydrolase [SAR202 cluster bacterium]|nr:CocE/NonD family hydrolase [SAR202 cluster bacterium]